MITNNHDPKKYGSTSWGESRGSGGFGSLSSAFSSRPVRGVFLSTNAALLKEAGVVSDFFAPPMLVGFIYEENSQHYVEIVIVNKQERLKVELPADVVSKLEPFQ